MADRIRLTVDLSFEQGARLRKNLTWGEQGYIFRKIVDEFNDFVEKYGKVGVAMFMSDQLSLMDVLTIKDKEAQGGLKGSKTKHTRTSKGGSSPTDPQNKGK